MQWSFEVMMVLKNNFAIKACICKLHRLFLNHVFTITINTCCPGLGPFFPLLPEQREQMISSWTAFLQYASLKSVGHKFRSSISFPSCCIYHNWQNFNNFHTFHFCLPPKLLRAPITLDKQRMLVHPFNVYSSFWVCLLFCNLFLSKECKHKH